MSAKAASKGAHTPVRLAIVGLAHDHVRQFIPDLLRQRDVQLVGIVEPNKDLVAEIAMRFCIAAKLFHPDLDRLLAETRVQVAALFTPTFDHAQIVEKCARLGIHVMMEKPMAVSLTDARRIAAAAGKGGIEVVVNYETTWYPSTQEAYNLVHRKRAIGELRKIVVHSGHGGPSPGCSRYFLDWLTDPVLNGAGALTDFGCYGADLATWLMDGLRPLSVFAVTQQLQPDVYPKVDDEATILLTYPRAQAIIQASWNWPFARKDMEIYGQSGAMRLPDLASLYLRKGSSPERRARVPALRAPHSNPISHLAAVVRGKIQSSGLGSVGVNLTVAEILEAARKSARTGKRINLS
jgi:scyllo-inositol 2-dehydrogenase (NADP+)